MHDKGKVVRIRKYDIAAISFKLNRGLGQVNYKYYNTLWYGTRTHTRANLNVSYIFQVYEALNVTKWSFRVRPDKFYNKLANVHSELALEVIMSQT